MSIFDRFRKAITRGPIAPTFQTQMVSSFGLPLTTIGPTFDANGLVFGARANELKYRDAYFKATHHNHKLFDMNGRLLQPGKLGAQPLLSTVQVASHYIPLDQRRPSTPYRLPRKIVSAFTGMVFGHGRFPQFRSDDPATADWATAIAESVGLEAKMIRARNLGGRQGTVGISWAWVDGVPRVTVHKGSNIHVLEWTDEDERIPAHVVEVYQATERTHTGSTAAYWWRRDWTPTADVVFQKVPVDKKNPEYWAVDEEQSTIHEDGFAHFVWIENLPSDDDDSGVDGACDYAEVYEPQISLDILNSVNVKGAALNLDPTLVLGVEPEDLTGGMVQKGSDNAVVVGKGGTASYLEVAGSAISAGISLVTHLRDQILETTECVVPDPNVVAAAGVSSVALKMIYAPMLGKCDILRYQYGKGIQQMLSQMTDSARRRLPEPGTEEPYPTVSSVDEDGNEVDEEVEFYVSLPPRIVVEPAIGPDGTPTGEITTKTEPRVPGRGRIWLEWGPYFEPTADDFQKDAGALSTATGGKPVMSQQTAVELFANARDRDGAEEWVRIQTEAKAAAERDSLSSAGMFPPIGGGDSPDLDPVVGGESGAVTIDLAPTDLAKVISVNEARKSQGLGPLLTVAGELDPDGALTIEQFTTGRQAAAAALGEKFADEVAQ